MIFSEKLLQISGKINDSDNLCLTPSITYPYTHRLITIGNIRKGELTPSIVRLIELDAISHNPIVIFIRTPGGDFEEAMLFRETLFSVKSPIITLAYDSCMSAGMFIYAAGSTRHCFKHTKFMAHSIRMCDVDMTSEQMKKEAKTLDRENRYMLSIIAQASNRKVSWWMKKLIDAKEKKEDAEGDFYFDAEYAKKIGFVNGEIWGPENQFSLKSYLYPAKK